MEAIPLTERFSVVWLNSGEFEDLNPVNRNQLFHLYHAVFGKTRDEIIAMVRWHSDSPGKVHYFIGLDGGEVVAFNYYLGFQGLNYSYALSGGSFAHPDHKGSFLPLFQFATKMMLSQTELLVGFCNANSYRIFCHPVNGWSEITAFRQFQLLAPIFSFSSCLNYKRISFPEIDTFTSTLFQLQRDYAFVSWRLSNLHDADIVQNTDTGAVSILKKFGKTMDVISILNCQTEAQYMGELVNLFAYYSESVVNFEGLNVYTSFNHAEAMISERFAFKVNPYERHLCVRGREPNSRDFSLSVEMIDSDLF